MSSKRLPMTAEIVRSNRRGGPEGVIDAVEQLAPDGFTDIEKVLSHAQREAIVRGYASKAGFAAPLGLAAVRRQSVRSPACPARRIRGGYERSGPRIGPAPCCADGAATRTALTRPEAAAGSGCCARRPAPPRRPASAPSCCGSPRTDRRAGRVGDTQNSTFAFRPDLLKMPCGLPTRQAHQIARRGLTSRRRRGRSRAVPSRM